MNNNFFKKKYLKYKKKYLQAKNILLEKKGGSEFMKSDSEDSSLSEKENSVDSIQLKRKDSDDSRLSKKEDSDDSFPFKRKDSEDSISSLTNLLNNLKMDEIKEEKKLLSKSDYEEKARLVIYSIVINLLKHYDNKMKVIKLNLSSSQLKKCMYDSKQVMKKIVKYGKDNLHTESEMLIDPEDLEIVKNFLEECDINIIDKDKYVKLIDLLEEPKINYEKELYYELGNTIEANLNYIDPTVNLSYDNYKGFLKSIKRILY